MQLEVGKRYIAANHTEVEIVDEHILGLVPRTFLYIGQFKFCNLTLTMYWNASGTVRNHFDMDPKGRWELVKECT